VTAALLSGRPSALHQALIARNPALPRSKTYMSDRLSDNIAASLAVTAALLMSGRPSALHQALIARNPALPRSKTHMSDRLSDNIAASLAVTAALLSGRPSALHQALIARNPACIAVGQPGLARLQSVPGRTLAEQVVANISCGVPGRLSTASVEPSEFGR
jgi:hypothetical protein